MLLFSHIYKGFIHDEFKKAFGEDYFRYDRQIDDGCSRKIPDWFRDCLTHSLLFECDEDQHKYTLCETKRMMALFQDLGNRPLIILRFNPDKYKNKEGNTIRGCFFFDDDNNIFSYHKEFK